ncbi:DUF6542 domain-containing protein [Streptomyces sp. NPDC046985]|uniref:DUF6542 domain-containing protein n=1 Tax=Streptomyces sp. NPDC046985 TaxID=3155377 RepID=UPI00340843A9
MPGPRLPNPRLTGLGAGLFCGAVMCALGFLVSVLCDDSPVVYGVLFLPVCVLTALWVRRGDLLTAPMVVPIGFAVGLLPVAEGDGFPATMMGLFTVLATQALWLYGGTLVAAAAVLARRVAGAGSPRLVGGGSPRLGGAGSPRPVGAGSSRPVVRVPAPPRGRR